MQRIDLYTPQTIETWYSPIVINCSNIKTKELSTIALKILKKYVKDNQVNIDFNNVKFTYYFKNSELIGLLSHLDRTHRVYGALRPYSKFKSNFIVSVYVNLEKKKFVLKKNLPKEIPITGKKLLFKKIKASWQEQIKVTLRNFRPILEDNLQHIRINPYLDSWQSKQGSFFLITLLFTEKYFRKPLCQTLEKLADLSCKISLPDRAWDRIYANVITDEFPALRRFSIEYLKAKICKKARKILSDKIFDLALLCFHTFEKSTQTVIPYYKRYQSFKFLRKIFISNSLPFNAFVKERVINEINQISVFEKQEIFNAVKKVFS